MVNLPGHLNVDNHEEDEEQEEEEEGTGDLPSKTLEYLLTGTEDSVKHARRLHEHGSDKKKESIDKAIQGLEAVHHLFDGGPTSHFNTKGHAIDDN
ncbi:hypothetical protein F5B20DRAFT_581246 [Whalleya microplaca]|nr:hypothetical protein F5B20DRAFT_581246 [Whalleya microplaca]